MAFNWAELYTVAEVLRTCNHEDISEEAFLRSATNRAYFMAYGVACTYAISHLGFQNTKTADCHAALRDLYRAKDRVDVANILEELRKWRNQCDYNDEVANAVSIATGAIKKAKQILSKL